jgi:hypothetical protein
MKKIWDAVSVFGSIIGIIDVLTKWLSMEFLKEYIYIIIGLISITYLIVSRTVDYFSKQKEKERQKQQETDLLTRLNQFKSAYDGTFNAHGQSLKALELTRHFSDDEINWLVKKGLVKLTIGYVF